MSATISDTTTHLFVIFSKTMNSDSSFLYDRIITPRRDILMIIMYKLIKTPVLA